MKKLLLLLILPLFLTAQAEKAIVNNSKWLTDYESALKQAKKVDKKILVFFTGSDWCPPCKMLKKDLFETNEFQTLSEKYVLLYVDIPMNKDLLTPEQLQHNKALASKLNKKGTVPLLKIISSKGQEVAKYSGYSMNGEISYHLKFLEKHQ